MALIKKKFQLLTPDGDYHPYANNRHEYWWDNWRFMNINAENMEIILSGSSFKYFGANKQW